MRLFKLILLLLLSIQLLDAKEFKVSYDPDYAPFSYAIDGKPYGLLIDIWRLFAKENHHTITFVKAKDWDDAIALAKEHKVAFFLGTTPYESWMKKSIPYYQTQTALYTLHKKPKNLSHIGLIGSDYKESLQKKFPTSTLHTYNDYDSLFQALIDHKVDAIYDDALALSYFAISHQYTPFIKKSNQLIESSKIHAISAKESNIALFDEGFKKLKTPQLKAIEAKWVSDESERYYGYLNRFIKHTISYVYDPDWRPFEWRDEMRNIHVGIISDLLNIISQKTGIKFEPIPTPNWETSVTLMKEHKADMFSAIPYTKERAKYLRFTKHNIYSYPAVLVSHKRRSLSLNEDFSHSTIAIVKGNSLGKWVQTKYPQATFKTFPNVKDALEAIEEEKVDFFAINGVTALYYINILGFNHTKIYTKIPYMFHLKLALQKDIEPEILLSIDHALADISQSQLNTIYHKWTSIKIQKELNGRLLFFIGLAILLLVIIFLLINKKLKKIVKEKTKELQELNTNLEEKVQERTKELAKTHQHIQDSITYASLIQSSILPQPTLFQKAFEDSFIIWKPKDIVGGDIYFFTEIEKDIFLLVIIDCTGHGVAGAFVTMLMKAIQEQLIQDIEGLTYHPDMILQYINRAFKELLNQENAHSNVGADAGVVIIDKKEELLHYAGANISLFYKEEGMVHRIKGDRKSLGYKQANLNDCYQNFTLSLQPNMQFYLTTDGYIDQNGGKKGFPLGRRRFEEILQEVSSYTLKDQKALFLKFFEAYKAQEEQNDDITLIGFQV